MLQFIIAFLITLGFAYVFNVRGKVSIVVSIVGGLSWSIYLVMMNFNFSIGFTYFILGAFTTLGSEIIARTFKVPVILALIPIITPTVPGSGAYYTMFYLFNGEQALSIQKAVDTLIMTGAMMLGFLVISDIFKLYSKYINKKLKKKEYIKKRE